jgi:hypothetical protein
VENISLIFSLISVVIAAIALGWNIYRDVVVSSRIKVSFSFTYLCGNDGQSNSRHIMLKGCNHRPLKTTINGICCRKSNVFLRLFGKENWRYIKYTKPFYEFSDDIPKQLEQGDDINIFFPKDVGFTKERFTHIGFYDNFGKNHWSARKDVRKFFRELGSEDVGKG